MPASASEPGSAFRRCAKPALTSARSSGSGGGATRLQADEHGVDVRHRVEHAARHRAQDAHLARQLGEHRRRAVGGAARLRREPLADLALDHRDLRRRRRAAPRPRAGSRSPPRRRAGSRRPWSAPARRRAQVEPHGVAEVQRGVRRTGRGRRAGRARARGRPRRRGRARRADARYSLSTPEPAADLEHDVVGRQRRLAPDHVEQVRVDQEVLPQVAVGADPERLQAAQARLRREPAHQPNRRAAFASTACSSSS